MTEDALEERYRDIKWRQPIPVSRADGVCGLACRFCVAVRGLKERDIGSLPQTIEAFYAHMLKRHHRAAEPLMTRHELSKRQKRHTSPKSADKSAKVK